jgi:hypothetical protein
MPETTVASPSIDERASVGKGGERDLEGDATPCQIRMTVTRRNVEQKNKQVQTLPVSDEIQ